MSKRGEGEGRQPTNFDLCGPQTPRANSGDRPPSSPPLSPQTIAPMLQGKITNTAYCHWPYRF